MKAVTFVVPDPPPIREHPGQSAGRDSPHAQVLVEAGEALVAAEPEAFPWTFSGVIVRFGRTMWNARRLGYSPEDPVYEVLCNVGAICEPGGYWSYTTQDPYADFYVVSFVSEDLGSSTEHPPAPSFVLTEVPPEFHGATMPEGGGPPDT
jgi:hypothetical protein